MARRPRADAPGSWHHVINRGIARRALFENRADARFFLARLARQVRSGRIEVHAYCLLTTHFHLLLRSPTGELSEAMRRVQNEHSRRFNRSRRRDGSLIRGRFFSRPVLSLEYRRALVRYIDANPVRAGIVRVSAEHELGSAAAYLNGTGPLWLTREWVEAEACRATGRARFTPDAYRTTFGPHDGTSEIADFVERRLTRAAESDPLDDFVGSAPPRVQAWMQRKAELADGLRVGLPVCGPVALRRALDEDGQGVWMIEDGSRTWRGKDVAWHGLLHDLCGFSWREVARLGDGSLARARRLGETHRRLMGTNPAYARRAAEVGHEAIRRCLGRGSARS